MTREEFDKLYLNKAVHCDTEEKAKEFLALAESVGYIWFGDTRAPEFTKWQIFKDDTHYFVKNFLWNGKSIESGSGDYYLKHDIDCVEFILQSRKLKEETIDDIIEEIGYHQKAINVLYNKLKMKAKVK